MTMKQCEHGHWFDIELSNVCPYCGKIVVSYPDTHKRVKRKGPLLFHRTVYAGPEYYHQRRNGTQQDSPEWVIKDIGASPETAAGPNYCMRCMRRLFRSEAVCPVCGYVPDNEPRLWHSLPTGALLHGGKYLVGTLLGQNSFRLTYIGMDQETGDRVAIKEYFPGGTAQRMDDGCMVVWNVPEEQWQKEREKYIRKARLMLSDVNALQGYREMYYWYIERVRDIFFQNRTAYIITDYIEGKTLWERVKNERKMEVGDCLRSLLPIMKSLEHMHERGLIHSHIRPDKIVIQSSGEPCLLDLCAVDMPVDDGRSELPFHDPFAPLELYAGKGEIGPQTDGYELCATLYYCVSGSVPPSAISIMQEQNFQFLESIPKCLAEELKEGFCECYRYLPLLNYIILESYEEYMESMRKEREGKAPVKALESGVCGERGLNATPYSPAGVHVSWMMYENGLLDIRGLGNICSCDWFVGNCEDYSLSWFDPEWVRWLKHITSISIQHGITGIGNRVFMFSENLTEVHIPASVLWIGNLAFHGCSSLRDVYYDGTKQQWEKIFIERDNECLNNAIFHFQQS